MPRPPTNEKDARVRASGGAGIGLVVAMRLRWRHVHFPLAILAEAVVLLAAFGTSWSWLFPLPNVVGRYPTRLDHFVEIRRRFLPADRASCFGSGRALKKPARSSSLVHETSQLFHERGRLVSQASKADHVFGKRAPRKAIPGLEPFELGYHLFVRKAYAPNGLESPHRRPPTPFGFRLWAPKCTSQMPRGSGRSW